MAAKLEMSLDEIVTANRGERRRGGRGGRRGRGGVRGARGMRGRRLARPAARIMRSAPYVAAMGGGSVDDDVWGHDGYEEQEQEGEDWGMASRTRQSAAAHAVGLSTGTRVLVSNLEFGVTTQDVKDLMEEVGDIKECEVDFDRSGRSLGTAHAVFARKVDALDCVRRYNNVPLDGKPLKISIMGANTAAAVAAAPTSVLSRLGPKMGRAAVAPSDIRVVVRAGAGGVRGMGRGRGRARGYAVAIPRGRGRGLGRGRGRGRRVVSAEELDADLNSYMGADVDDFEE